MFEQETDTIIKLIFERLPHNPTDSVSVKEILAADIPYPIKTFFRADVESLLLHELHRLHQGSRFHYTHHEVQSLQRQINSVLVLNYSFRRTEFEQRVNDAVHMLINYLIRPQWTLASIVFEKDTTISGQALGGLLRHFGPFEYLREIVSQYLREKQIGALTKEEFQSLLWKIDGEYIRRKSGDELATMILPIYDFFDFPAKTGNYAFSTKAVIKFFEDKGLAMVLPRLEGELAQGKIAFLRRELGELLEDVRRTLGAFQVEKIEVDHGELIMNSGTIESGSSHAEADPGSIQPGRKFDFHSAISESDKKKLIRKIFKHDEHAFDAALHSLGRQSNWKNVSISIDELFIQYDIDPYSSEAKRFVEILFKFVHPAT